MAYNMTMMIGKTVFDVISYSLEMDNSTGGKETTVMGRMIVLKFVDETSADLLQNLLAGETKMETATLTVAESKDKKYIEYVLHDARVERIEIGGSNREKKYAESIHIKFYKMDFTPKGKKATYDAATHSPSAQRKKSS